MFVGSHGHETNVAHGSQPLHQPPVSPPWEMFLSIEQCNAQPAPTLPWPPPLQHHPCPHVPSSRSHLSGMWTNSCTHHFCVKATIKYFNYNYFCPTHFHEWTIVWAAKINCGSLGLCFTRAVVRDCGRGPSCGHQPSPAQPSTWHGHGPGSGLGLGGH